MENQKNNLTKQKNDKTEKNWRLILSIGGLLLLILGLAAFFLLSKDKFENGIPWIMIAVAVLIVVVGIVAVIAVAKKKGKHEPDYFTFFIMGVMWIPIGFATDNPAFWIMGLIFMAIGLANKSKWKKKIWHDLDPMQKKLKIALVIILSIMVLLGLVAYFLTAS